MGAWGAGAFENDAALDWVADLLEVGPSHLGATLDAVLGAEGYLEVDLGCEGLAACDVIASLRGHEASTAEVRAWAIANSDVPTDDLLRRALDVLDRIVGPESELAELWGSSGEAGLSFDSLRERLLAPVAKPSETRVSGAKRARTTSDLRTIAEANSPDGRVVARIIESRSDGGEHTQVLLEFLELRGGGGAVSAHTPGADLMVEWSDSRTLVVHHPAGLKMVRSVSGEVIKHFDVSVLVVLAPYTKREQL